MSNKLMPQSYGKYPPNAWTEPKKFILLQPTVLPETLRRVCHVRTARGTGNPIDKHHAPKNNSLDPAGRPDSLCGGGPRHGRRHAAQPGHTPRRHCRGGSLHRFSQALLHGFALGRRPEGVALLPLPVEQRAVAAHGRDGPLRLRPPRHAVEPRLRLPAALGARGGAGL